MVIVRSITLTKVKETITFSQCHSFTFLWLKTSNFKSSWSFNRGVKQTKITFGTAVSWPRPLNQGGRWKEVFITVYSWQFFRDLGRWPPNKGWPLNRRPLNRGSTVNKSKTEGMWLGPSRRNTAKPLGIAWPANSILALAIIFSYNDEIVYNKNFEQQLTKMKGLLKGATSRLALLEKFSLNVSSSSFALRVYLPLP